MDPVTHGLAGATVGQLFADKEKFRLASLLGFGSALLADADVFISSASDPLLTLEYHRQFSHSLLFIPIGAAVAALLVWWLVRKKLSFKETYLYCLGGYATAGLMDVITSYGVHLFWPFVDHRYSLDIISVFDPVFTLGLLIPVGFAWYFRIKKPAFFTLAWMTLYLLFGFSQQQKASELAQNIASVQGHQTEQLVVKPTIANQVLWSVRYISEGQVYSYGLNLIPFTEPKVYEGDSRALLDWQAFYSAYEGSVMYEDIRRFSEVSEGYLIGHPEQDNVIGDARYSMLPTTLSPLWGIRVDTARTDQHVEFRTYRDTSPETRSLFIRMLKGQDLPADYKYE